MLLQKKKNEQNWNGWGRQEIRKISWCYEADDKEILFLEKF